MLHREGAMLILDDGADGIQIQIEALVQAVMILSIGVLIIVTNVIIIATFITAPGQLLYIHLLGQSAKIWTSHTVHTHG